MDYKRRLADTLVFALVQAWLASRLVNPGCGVAGRRLRFEEELMLRVRWMAVLVLAASVWLAGCSDDNGGRRSDVGDDADVTTDTQIDQPETNVCGERTTCRGTADCNAATEFCNAGCCDLRQVEERCTVQDQACTSDAWSTATHLCDTGLGLCLARCDTSEPECRAGSWCFELNDPRDSDLDGACLSGDCCRPGEECSFSCNDGTGTCFAVGNGASFCLDAGDAGEGDACVQGSAGECATNANCPAEFTCSDGTCVPRLNFVCESGLFCFNGECVSPCSGDGQCTTPETCVPVFDQTGANRPGLCGTECEPFSSGECGEDGYCEVQIGAFSGEITAWFCGEFDVPAAQRRGYLAACDPAGVANQCGEGLVCVTEFASDTTGTCQQLCDSTLQSEQALANCPLSEPTPLFVTNTTEDFFEALSVSETATVAAVEGETLQLALASGGGAPTVATFLGGVDLAAGTASTVVAYLNASDSPALRVFEDLADGTPGLEQGDAGLRVYNVSDTAVTVGRVDPYFTPPVDRGEYDPFLVDLGETSTNFLTGYFDEDTHEYYGFVFNNVATADVTTDIVEVVVFTTPVGDEHDVLVKWFEVDVPDDLATTGEAAIRVINAAPGRPSVDVDYGANGTVDFDDLGYAEATTDGAGEWRIFVIDPDSPSMPVRLSWGPTAEERLDFTLGGLQAGYVVTYILHETAAGPQGWMTWFSLADPDIVQIRADLDASADDDVVVRLINASRSEVILAREESVALGTAASGATLPAGDGVVKLAPTGESGTVTFSLRAEGVAATARPSELAVGVDDVVAGEYVQLFIAERAANAGLVSLLEMWEPFDVSTLGGGEAGLRFAHLIEGAADATVQLRGESFQICVPLTVAGLGRCSDACNPYMGGEPFADSTGDPTERWLQNGCNHSEEVAYACLPFVTTGNQDIPYHLDGHPDLAGFCIPRQIPAAGFRGFGGECTTTGDASCNPDSFCVGVSETRAECLKLCQPLTGLGHSDCQYTIGQDGYPTDIETLCLPAILPQQYGLCLEPQLPNLREGDPCTNAQRGFTCGGDDDVMCIGVSETTSECTRFCVRGLDETCPPLRDGSQRQCYNPGVPRIFGAPVPGWVSVCESAN
jgi:hypothetical protein